MNDSRDRSEALLQLEALMEQDSGLREKYNTLTSMVEDICPFTASLEGMYDEIITLQNQFEESLVCNDGLEVCA